MQNDNELAALIIRNVVDLEHSLRFLEEVVDPRMTEEVFDLLERTGSGDWYFKDRTDLSEWFCPRNWLLQSTGKPKADLWFQLETPDDDPWDSWVASFAGGKSAETTAALFLKYAGLGKTKWNELINEDPELIGKLRAAGFIVGNSQIYYPLPLNREELAKAFLNDDFSTAFTRVQEAAAALDRVLPALDRLRDAQEVAKTKN